MDTVLLADDDPNVLLFVTKVLEDKGYQCLTAADGQTAQQLVQANQDQITAILLDWKMPKMTGIELLQWIKTQPVLEDIPVIMETAMVDPQNIREGIDAGAFYYLTKPMEIEVLQSIVRAAVSDFHYKKALLKKIKESENPFNLMVEGVFRFQTLVQGEYLALRIANASPNPERVVVISELIINAIEHGNLGITYDEKSDYVGQGILHAEIERRLALPQFAAKQVELRIDKSRDQMTVLIKDQGEGFDFTGYLTFDEARVFHTHGRGIAIANAYLDIQYLGNGSQVLVTIPFA